MPGLCRDCGAFGGLSPPACPDCGSRRVLEHAELADLSLAHVDCDAFYAAVEKRDRPELREQPVIIGGGRRGVVATACYLARSAGVHSAMPMFEARRRCPEATVLAPDMPRYSAVAEQIREQMRALTPVLETVSIDEAVLDLGGTERLFGCPPAVSMARFARSVESEIGITVSVGLSCNRLLAKIACGLEKPNGYSVLGRGEAVAFLAPRPVGILPGVGPVLQRKMQEQGVHTVGDLAKCAPEDLVHRFGKFGRRLAEFARGQDLRPVQPDRPAKSVSVEVTLEQPLAAPERMQVVLAQLVEALSVRLQRQGLAGQVVVLKLKTTDFRILTRSRTAAVPVQSEGEILPLVRPLLAREADGRSFRLIGVGVKVLAELRGKAAVKRLLVLPEDEDPRLEHALRKIRDLYGEDVLRKGVDQPPPLQPQGPSKR